MAKSRTTSRSSVPPKKPAKARSEKKPAKASAKKKPAKARSSKVATSMPDSARETALFLAKLALDKKALDVTVLDVRGLASYAEYFVLMTAESDPQMGAIADYLGVKMKERGEPPLGIEGTRAGRWVLIDFGDVVAHVFYQDARAFYDLEGLWADAARVQVVDHR